MKMKKIISVKYLLPVLLLGGILFLVSFKSKTAEKNGRPVRVVSLCFKNQDFGKIVKIVDQEGAKGTDIIVLPETWRGQIEPEAIDGETITTLSKLAKKHHTYILSPIDRKDGNSRYNTAVLIDREGKVVFAYDKVYPYWAEFDLSAGPVSPGANGQMVYDTDFGRIGAGICFDSNFPEVWQALRDKGAEVVFWPSAYSAGSQLQAYALMHHYYIVTSTYTKDCQVYDITGERILDEKSDDVTVARITLDLDRSIYHENFNMSKLDKLLKAHGNEVEQEVFMSREQWFVLRAKKPGVSARSLAKEFGLEELTAYQNRSRTEIDKKRGYDFAKKVVSVE
jgi:predicted amidohydrolase